MNKIQLPHLKNVLLKGFLTFTKGVKIADNDIRINQEFKPILVDKKHVEEYKNYFKFNSELPLTYLYLFAQRAQVSLMLEKQFTIAIPGLIHITNEIEKLTEIDKNQSLNINSSVFVEAKKEGSLKPIFKVEFYQKEVLVAKCESVYIAKRKLKLSKKQREDPKLLINPIFQEKWKLTKKDARNYANLSGDNNPIHISTIIAKMFGFKSSIIHGWYLVSRIVRGIENHQKNEIKKVSCEFLKAIELPSEVQVLIKESNVQIISNNRTCFTAKVK